MQLQPHPFSIPFLLAAIVSAGFAVTIWRLRHAPGAISLFVHMLGLATWSGANAAMWLSTSLRAQLFWLDFSALGILFVPAIFLLFSLQISHNERLLTRRLIFFFTIEPLIGLSLIWTNGLHHLVYGPAKLWVSKGLAELHWSPGPFIPVDAVYSYLLMAAGIWFLVRSLKKGGHLMQAQLKMVILGASLSLCADLVTLLPSLSSGNGLDAVPIVYTLAGGIYVYAIYRTKLLDLIPVAHSALINSMTDGVVVLDEQDRIVEMNPAAGKFLGITPGQAAGRGAKQILSAWRETTRPFWNQSEVRTEIVVTQDIPRTIDLNVTPLTDRKKRTTGRVLVFRDITRRKQDEAILKDTNKELNGQLNEIRTLRDQLRDQATRDPLTNLYNRRYLEEMLLQELARASRENYPIGVIMMDIDRFKRVNDTCGHKAGDEVLQALAALIISHIRRFDAACRFGGEEFVIVMPRLPGEMARERAEFLRKEFANMPLPCADMKTSPTLSIGLASYPLDGNDSEQLLNAADQALYAAKSSGRNRVVVYSELVERRGSSEDNNSR